jgi:GNAT superfamily N-acetyltransferase
MIAIPPAIHVEAIDGQAAAELTHLIGPRWMQTPYSAAVDSELVRREILTDQPTSIYPVRWQHVRHLAAWRAGQLVGFLDAAVGLDSDSPDVPDYRPYGLIRFLEVPGRAELVNEVAAALFVAVQVFWQEAGVGFVKAFHLSTGYPSWQGGVGILPGEWGDHVRVLTAAGYLLRERYYGYVRRLVEPVEEVTPQGDLSLVYRGDWQDRRYEVYHRRVELVARARVVRATMALSTGRLPLARVVDLWVDPQWRLKDIGKWLLRRIINDATHQADAHIVAHLAQHHHAALNLLIQQGFQEMSTRGYSLDKALTR